VRDASGTVTDIIGLAIAGPIYLWQRFRFSKATV
jgi:hypothetical protein